MFEEFNDRKRQRNIPPDNSEFLQMLLNLFYENTFIYENTFNSYSITANELTRQLQTVLQDEFIGDIHIKQNNTLVLCLTNGEQFNIRIEKSSLSNFHF